MVFQSGLFDQIQDDSGGILLAALRHGVLKGLSVFVDLLYGLCDLRVQIVGGHHYAVSLPCKRVGVQDLVASGACCKGDQDIGDLQGQDLTDGVGAGSGDHKVGGGKEVL